MGYWLDGESTIREPSPCLTVELEPLCESRVAYAAGRAAVNGLALQPKTQLESHGAIGAFLRWAGREGYRVDGRSLGLVAPRVPDKVPTVYHIAEVRAVRAACNPEVPMEDLMVRGS